VDKLGGQLLSDVDNSFIFDTYKDLWKTDKQQKNMIGQGVDGTQRQGATKNAAIVDQFKKQYAIPIDFELYSDHAPFYPFAINEDFVRDITFNDKKYVPRGDADDYGYTIKNIALEYDTLYSEILARQFEVDLSQGISFIYDYVTYFKAQPTN
jgi:hypothetical protein